MPLQKGDLADLLNFGFGIAIIVLAVAALYVFGAFDRHTFDNQTIIDECTALCIGQNFTQVTQAAKYDSQISCGCIQNITFNNKTWHTREPVIYISEIKK